MSRKLYLALVGLSLFSGSFAGKTQEAGDWNPPETAIRQTTVNLGQFLLKHGMGDPRGGQFGLASVYRRFTMNDLREQMALYQGWYGSKQFGWLKGQTFVGIDGLVYRAKDFQPVSLEAAADRALELQRSSGQRSKPDEEALRNASYDLLSNQGRLMVLISGNVDIAEKLGRIPQEQRAVYLQLAKVPQADDIRIDELERFVRSLWTECVMAHMSGDSEEAVRLSKTICDNRKAYSDKLISSAAYKKQLAMAKGKPTEPFDYLDVVPVLLADNDRRLREGTKTVDLKAIATLNQSERIAKLIDWLDQIGSMPNVIRGNRGLLDYELGTALVKEGEAAVEPLIQAMYHDFRPTQEAPGYISADGRFVYPTVSRMAAFLFERITGVNPSLLAASGLPAEADLKAIWEQWKGQTHDQRWMSILKTEGNSSSHYVEAANWFGGRVYQASVKDNGQVQNPLVPRTELLSDADKKELGSLLAKRANEALTAFNPAVAEPVSDLLNAVAMAKVLNSVSEKDSVPVLRECLKAGYSIDVPKQRTSGQHGVWPVSTPCLLLARAGDTVPTIDYLERLAEHADIFPIGSISFLPLFYLDGSQHDELVGKLISGSKSKFRLSFQAEAYGARQIGDLLFTPLVKFPSFRKEYLRLMQSKEVPGKVELSITDKHADFRVNSRFEARELLTPSEIDEARGAVLRTGDLLALSVSQMRGAPKFKLTWPVEKKDAAIEALANYLNEHWKLALETSVARIARY